jgi:hypothetical protein
MKHLRIFEDFSQDDWQNRYDQLVRDMEEEAEPEGGPIADQYGRDMEELERERDRSGSEDMSVYKSESDMVGDVIKQLETYLNYKQVSNLIDHVEDGRDEFFINTRLDFYGVSEEDKPIVIGLLDTLRELN